MRVIKHRNGTYSITDLRKSDLQDLEASVYMRFASFLKSSEATSLPSGYPGWTLDQFRSISAEIADSHLKIAKILKEYAWDGK